MKDHDENDVTRRKCLWIMDYGKKKERRREEREKRETKTQRLRSSKIKNISQKIKQNE